MSTPPNIPPLVPRLRIYRDDLARAKPKTTQSTEEPDMKAPVVPHAPAAKEHPNPGRQTKTPVTKLAPKSVAPAPVQKPSTVPTPPSTPVSVTKQKPFRTETPAARQELATIASKKRRTEGTVDTDALDAQMATEMGDGMIVTDTRRDGFKLFPAIKDALTTWLFQKKEAFQKEEKPRYTVAPAETRREVIERAATGGVLAPKNDYQQVASRLRHVPRVKISTKPIVRDASEVPKPTWHKVGEEPAAPLPPKPEPVQPIAPVKPEPKPVPQAPAPKPAPKPASEPKKEAPAPKPKRVPRKRTPGSLRRTLAYIGVALVALAAAAAGFGIVVWFTSDREDAPVIPAEQQFANPGFTATNTFPVALATTRSGLLTAIDREVSRSDMNGLTHIVPMATETGAATAGEVFTVLAPNAPGAFVRAVTDIHFGAYQRTPFVILKVPNFDTALGGMLAWEQALDDDLAELFGSPVTGTVRPTARSTTPTEPVFVDTVHANRDMRVLYNESSDEHVVYSFLNRTTILITKTTDGLAAIAPLVE